MTEVTLRRDGRRYEVAASGHATGSPEACAAVSVLIFTLDAFMQNAPVFVIEERLEPGDALLQFSGDKEAEDAFDMITLGFLMLQERFPDIVEVSLLESEL